MESTTIFSISFSKRFSTFVILTLGLLSPTFVAGDEAHARVGVSETINVKLNRLLQRVTKHTDQKFHYG